MMMQRALTRLRSLLAGLPTGLLILLAPLPSAQAAKPEPARLTVEASARLVFQILASEFAIQGGDLRAAAAVYLRLTQETRDPAVAERAAQLLLAVRAPEEALEAARIWLAGDPSSREALDMVDLLSVLLGRVDDLSQSLIARREFARQQGTLDDFYDRSSQLAMRSPQPHLGLQLLEKVSEPDPTHPTPLYHRAMLHEQLNDPAEMERLLRELVRLHPDHAHGLNALGYSLADRNTQLAEAQGLIEKAHRLKPDNGHIIDSLGWLYYRLGRLQEAKRWLSLAYEKQADAEIAAHLGEVLWVMQEADTALSVFREAVRRDPTNRVLTETLRRLGLSFTRPSADNPSSPTEGL